MSCFKVPLYNREGEVVGWTAVDAQDVGFVTGHRWSLAHGYAVRSERPHGQFRLHRELLGLPQKGRDPEVDHLNGDKLDNRRVNLRVATRQENNQNTDRFTGVDWNKGKWRARVRHNVVEHYLGHFEDRKVAEAVADSKRAELVTMPERPPLLDYDNLPVAEVRARIKG